MEKILSSNISASMWHLLRHALPVDCSVQARGITLVSRCRCCVLPKLESLVHLFIQSKVATAVWKCFGEIFHLPFKFNSLLQALNIWMAPTSDHTQYGVCRASVAVQICREIWVARCAATFESKAMKARAICLRVLQRVQLINLITCPTRKYTRIQENSLEIMGISHTRVRPKQGVWCKWDTLSRGWFKLNIDGSAIGEKITVGGIIREDQGKFIGGFSVWYGTRTNTLAELLALRHGLLMCLAMNIAQVCVESDSMVVVMAVQPGRPDNWRLEFVLRECLNLIPARAEIVHGYRQKNQVADRLAAFAHAHKKRLEYYRVRGLPKEARRAFLADINGIWSFRR